MQADTITLIACASVVVPIIAVAVIYVCCVCIGDNKMKNHSSRVSTVLQSVGLASTATQRANGDVERGEGAHHQIQRSSTYNGTKDGGMVILVGAGAAFATAAVVAAVTSGVHGSGGDGGGGGGSACGGDDGGACGGGCGGCGAD